ncbi:MAG: ribonuclease R [Thioalkalivibrionaceae bacterium]
MSPKKAHRTDPFAEREAQKYERPVASREWLLEIVLDAGKPLEYEEIAERVDVDLEDEDRAEALRRRLKAMERDGQLIVNRRGGYLPVNQSDLIAGRVQGHPDGFGFLIPDDQSDDLFLSPRQMRGILHGDRVVARVMGVDHRGRREGGIVEVLERAHDELVGRLRITDGFGVLLPDGKRIAQDVLIAPDDLGAALDGQIVVVRLKPQANRHARLQGVVTEIIGEHLAPGMEIEVAIRSHGLRHSFPAPVIEAAAAFGDAVPEAAREGRVDLRDRSLVTIDGEDSKDFDDALFVETCEGGWRLIVAIADVSTYVEMGGALDEEAQKRATSVYFPNHVLPMLPEALSNGLCSLNPNVDRLCLAVEIEIGKRGAIRRFNFFEGLMRSAARLTYTEVAQVLEGDDATRERRAAVVPMLETLHDLFRALAGARSRRGAIEFESTETRILFSADRKIERIVPTVRNDAHRIVEECMIAANVCAARFLRKAKLPTLYRVHDTPPSQKLADLRLFLAGMGLSLDGGDEPKPKHYAQLLSSAAQREDRNLIQTVMLRSLSQAVYSPHPNGHFGLALEDYAHFTSPIRRYPDLLVHRGIRHLLAGGKPSGFRYSTPAMEALGEHCSMAERRADEATRDAVAWLKAEYMQDKVGDVFPGTITGVTSFGLFVEIDDVFIEGLVHVTNLDRDYYHFDPVRHQLVGEHGGRSFGIGQKIQVRVVRVSLDDRKIDLALPDSADGDRRRPANDDGARKKSGRGKARSRSRRRGGHDGHSDGSSTG